MYMLRGFTPGDPFPFVRSTLLSFRDSDASSTSISEPGTVSAGDLLIAVLATDTSATQSTSSSGWTELADFALNNNTGRLGVFIGVQGTAGALSVAHAADHASWGMMAIGNWNGVLADVKIATGILSFSDDPPALTPSTGLDDYLWITGHSADGGSNWPNTAPTGFTGFERIRCNSASTGTHTTLAWAYRQERASTKDPASFTGEFPANGGAFTLSVR